MEVMASNEKFRRHIRIVRENSGFIFQVLTWKKQVTIHYASQKTAVKTSRSWTQLQIEK